MLDLAHRPQHTSAFPPDLSHHPRLSASLLKGQTCGWCLLICRTGWATSCQRVYVFVCCINHCLQNFLTKHLEHTTQNEWSKHVRFLLFCSRNDLSYLWPGGEKKESCLSDVQYATDSSVHHYTELMLVKFPFFSKNLRLGHKNSCCPSSTKYGDKEEDFLKVCELVVKTITSTSLKDTNWP